MMEAGTMPVELIDAMIAERDRLRRIQRVERAVLTKEELPVDNPLKMKLAAIEAICVRALACANCQDDYIRALEEIQCEVAVEVVERDIGDPVA